MAFFLEPSSIGKWGGQLKTTKQEIQDFTYTTKGKLVKNSSRILLLAIISY